MREKEKTLRGAGFMRVSRLSHASRDVICSAIAHGKLRHTLSIGAARFGSQ
jgi:hypothetical protein